MQGNIWQQLGVFVLAVAFAILFVSKDSRKEEIEEEKTNKAEDKTS